MKTNTLPLPTTHNRAPGLRATPARRPDELHELHWMLAAFIRYAFHIPDHVRMVQSTRELPIALERIASDTEMREGAWLAWTDQQRTWFVAGEFAEAPQQALRTHFYDDYGRIAASATWILRRNGRWQLWDR